MMRIALSGRCLSRPFEILSGPGAFLMLRLFMMFVKASNGISLNSDWGSLSLEINLGGVICLELLLVAFAVGKKCSSTGGIISCGFAPSRMGTARFFGFSLLEMI